MIGESSSIAKDARQKKAAFSVGGEDLNFFDAAISAWCPGTSASPFAPLKLTGLATPNYGDKQLLNMLL